MSVVLFDRATFQTSRREITEQGYLRVPGKIARTGTQDYLAGELGLTDRAPTERVTVYRPPEEVFAPASLATYKDADITVDHKGMVDSKSFKSYSAGHVSGDAYRSGDWVEADLLFKDAAAIKEIENGTVELSAGYEAEYIPEKGVTQDGEAYDFIQRNIKINHVALVEKARAGNQARIYDGGEKPMYQVTIDGNVITVPDQPTQQLIQRSFDNLSKKANDSEKSLQEMKDERSELQAKLDAKDEEMEKLKADTSDTALAEKLKTLDAARQGAHKLAGDKLGTVDSLDPMAHKVAALAVVRPSMDWAAKAKDDPKYVSVAYDMAMEAKEAEDEEEEKRKKNTDDSFAKFGQGMQQAASRATHDSDPQATLDAAYEAKQARIAKAWQKTEGA